MMATTHFFFFSPFQFDGFNPMEDDNEYERERKQRIAENLAFLQSLGLQKVVTTSSDKYTTKRSRAKGGPAEDPDFVPAASPQARAPPRRSTRRKDTTSGNTEVVASDEQDYFTDKKKRRRNHAGRRVVHGRIYDSEKGTTCHQCRQKVDGS